MSGERSQTFRMDVPCDVYTVRSGHSQRRCSASQHALQGRGTTDLRARLAKSLPSLPNASCRSWCFAFPAISPRSSNPPGCTSAAPYARVSTATHSGVR